MAESNLKQKPVIFITDDRKEDWWLERNGKTIGPRPELLEEFLSKTGQSFYMYRPQQFLLYSKDKLGSTVSDNTIEEVKELDNAKDHSNREREIFVRAALRHSRMPSFKFLKSLQNNVDNELNEIDDLNYEPPAARHKDNLIISKDLNVFLWKSRALIMDLESRAGRIEKDIILANRIHDEEEITSLNERLSYIKSKIKECLIAEDRVVQAFSRLNSGKVDDKD